MSDSATITLPPRRALVAEAADSIRGAIADGRWPVGTQLPSEPQLAVEVGVSRATLREGLRLLTSEGLLARRPGVGTFVARVPPASIERGIDELFSLRDAITQLGHRATTRDCTVSIEPGLPPVTGELGLPSRAEVCRVRRVRCADDQPVILCEDYFSSDLLGQQPVQLADLASEIVGAGSLYAWLDQLLGAPIDSALAHIEAANASPEQARALRLPPGTALLRMRQTHFTNDGQAVLYSDSLHNGAFMHFHLRRKRMAAVPEARERR